MHVASVEEPILATDDDGSQRALTACVVEGEPALFENTAKLGFLILCIPERFGREVRRQRGPDWGCPGACRGPRRAARSLRAGTKCAAPWCGPVWALLLERVARTDLHGDSCVSASGACSHGVQVQVAFRPFSRLEIPTRLTAVWRILPS